MTSTEQKLKALAALVDAIMMTLKASGSMGVSEGQLFVGLMSIPSFRAEHLSQILNALVKAGKVTRTNRIVKAVR